MTNPRNQKFEIIKDKFTHSEISIDDLEKTNNLIKLKSEKMETI